MTISIGKNYIGGQWVVGGAGKLAVTDPATGALIQHQALADAADVDAAVGAARALVNSRALSGLRPVERGRMVRRMGEFLLLHCDEIARLLSRESGKPLWEAVIEVEGSARYFEYYGNQAETVEGRSIPLGDDYFDFTVHEPMGISAQVIPWNYPLEMTARSLSAALATGNACIIKSPELDPLSCAYYALAAEYAGLPAGAVNVLCGHGHHAGAALVAHPGINQVVFTGSVQTGIAIGQAAAANVVPCVLELGGKSAAIVRTDADLDNLIGNIRWGIFFNAGQVCSAMSRVIAHADVYDRVVEAAAGLASQISTGPGIEREQMGLNMGALVSLGQRDRAQGMVTEAARQGARVVAGGVASEQGAFLTPTVLAGVEPSMNIAQDEVFGPVLSVIKAHDDVQALAIANGTDYGLVAGVFSRDISASMGLARDLRAGQVFINEWFAGGVETPFGGYGKSGYGREKGREALWNYVQTKNIAVRI